MFYLRVIQRTSDGPSMFILFAGNYSGTLAPINWSRYSIFINNLSIYKSVQQQVLKLFFHDTINIQVRGRGLVKYINTLLL